MHAYMIRLTNLGARYVPADPEQPDTRPCIELAGSQCYFYVDPSGRLRVSVHLDGLPEYGQHLWGENAVPLLIDVGDATVYDSRVHERYRQLFREADHLARAWVTARAQILAVPGGCNWLPDARRPFERAAWRVLEDFARD